MATGVIGAAGGLGGFLLPSLLGYLKGAAGTFAAGFLFLSVAGLAALAFLLAQRRRWLESLVPAAPAVGAPLAEPVTD